MTVYGLSDLGPSCTPPVPSPWDTIQTGAQTRLREATVRPPARILAAWGVCHLPEAGAAWPRCRGAARRCRRAAGGPDLDAVRQPHQLAGESHGPGSGSAELGLESGVVPVVALGDDVVAEEVIGRDDVEGHGFACVVAGHVPFHDGPVGAVAVGMPDRVVEPRERAGLAAQVVEHRRAAAQPGVGVAVLEVVRVET